VTGESRHATPGWYGKMPSLGDFASRRVPDEFVRPWDAWLQEMLQASKDTIGEAWLDHYLVMPIWRFVLLPGLLGPSGWAGLLMPSVDRVGRHFPLTLTVSLTSVEEMAEVVFSEGEWFAHLENVALSALDPIRGPEEFDGAVAACVLTTSCVGEVDGETGVKRRRLLSVEDFGLVAAGEALGAWAQQSGWSSLWWTRGRVNGHSLMIGAAALPTPGEFSWLLAEQSVPTSTHLDEAS
jgi:type VI secretion system protein ImpM